MKLVASAIFLIVMFAVYGAIGSHFKGDSAIFVRYAVVAMLSFVAILVHELGHAAAVIMVGGKLKTIVVLPFAYRFSTRKFKLTWRPKGSEIGGYVSYDLDRIGSHAKHVVVAVAGPLSNLFLTALLAATSWLARVRPEQSVAGSLVAALAVLSCGMAIVNSIPFKGSDGSAIVRSWRAIRASAARRSL